MGKTKARKIKRRRPPPPGVPSVVEMVDEEELVYETKDQRAVESVLDKLKSFSPEDKECGAVIIAHMTDNPKFVAQLIACDGIKILAPLLVDPNPSVRHNVCGCLRNLSTCNAEVLEEMVKDDVMTPLIGLFKQYTANWTPTVCPEEIIDSKTEIFIEACNLLSCLCESSSSLSLDAFNQSDLISVLLPCLNVQVFGYDVTLAVVQCLHTVTENNPGLIAKIIQPMKDILHSFILSSPVQPIQVQLRILAMGIILNLNSGKISMCKPLLGDAIMTVLEETLAIAIQPDVDRLEEAIKCYKEMKKDKYKEPSELEKHFSAIIDSFKAFQFVLAGKQTALEILTNICCSDDSDMDETASNCTSEELTDSDDDVPCVPANLGMDIPCEIHGLIVQKKVVQKVLEQLVFPHKITALWFREIPEGQTCLKRLHAVRCRALFCINNIVQGLKVEELGGTAKLFQMWERLCFLMFSEADPSDSEQVDAATSSLRAVVQKLGEGHSAPHFSGMSDKGLVLFFDVFQQCHDSSVKVNIVRIVASIGCILVDVKEEHAYALIKIIGLFLIEVCMKSADLWVTSEALDAIFDVFSEDHLDGIAEKINLVTKLRTVLPSLKIKDKQQREALGEHLPVIKAAKCNLLRFLRYKENLHKSKK